MDNMSGIGNTIDLNDISNRTNGVTSFIWVMLTTETIEYNE